MSSLELPIGIADFQAIRNQNCYYADKTAHIGKLAAQHRYFFLSRPRRFGKSLLVSTLKHLFEGDEPLFRGLHIHNNWDWSASHPVVRLSFDAKYDEPGKVGSYLKSRLNWIASNYGNLEEIYPDQAHEFLENVMRRLHKNWSACSYPGGRA